MKAKPTNSPFQKGCQVLFILFFLYLNVNGQDFVFNKKTVEDGLSQNTISDIVQDKQGFIWVGTRNGLNRYDGHKFVTFELEPSNKNSIFSNNIYPVFYDSTLGLWVVTDNVLNKYDPVTNSFKRIDINSKGRYYPFNIIFSLARENDESIWIGEWSGLHLLNINTLKIRSAQKMGLLSADENFKIRTVYKDSKGFLWVANSKELIRIKYGSGKVERKIFRNNKNDLNSISNNIISVIYEDPNGLLWIGTYDGLNLFDYKTETFTQFKHNPNDPNSISNNYIRASLANDNYGNLWVPTQDGLCILNIATRKFTTYKNDPLDLKSISQNSIFSVLKDAIGNMWVGTSYRGLNVVYNPNYNTPIFQNVYTPPFLSSNLVSTIAVDKNKMWVGTEDGGLNKIDRVDHNVTRFNMNQKDEKQLKSNSIKATLIDKDNNVWLGIQGCGPYVASSGTQIFKEIKKDMSFLSAPQSSIWDILEDSYGLFWIAAHRGLFAYTRHGTTLKPYRIQKNLAILQNIHINTLLEDKERNLWIGTYDGLYFLRPSREGSLKKVPISHHIKRINCIAEDTKGDIWVGLYYGGLAKYDKEKNTLVPFNLPNGLPNSNVLGILEDERNNLWISTSNGLVFYNVAKNTSLTYTKTDGLISNEFNYNASYKSASGEFFFGTLNGLVSFFPNKAKENLQESPLVFTCLNVLNVLINPKDSSHILEKDINYIQNLKLKHDQNTFSINFALLNYIKSNKNSYAYKLKEVHADWIRTMTPTASFTNLAPGKYTLLVKGANNDGFWSQPRSLTITILNPIWATWWAYLIYALIALGILFFIIRSFYMRALLKRDNELHELKLNFFTNISHEIRTHLTLIKTPVEKMEQEYKQNPGLLRQLSNLKNNSRRLLHLVNELMDFRKAETKSLQLNVERHELIGFLTSIYETFEDVSIARNMRTKFVHNADNLYLYFDGDQVAKVFFNLLSNAFKFTPDGGRIEVLVEESESNVYIHITDNGKGIAAENIEKVFTNFYQVEDNPAENTGYGIGLALSKAIVNLHKGNLTATSVQSQNGKAGSTCFTVALLKGKQHFKPTDLHKSNGHNLILENEIDNNKIIKTPVVSELENTSQYNILVVEDNEQIRQLLKETLQNYTVTLSENGEKGWHAAIEIIPDIIISDVMMPEMDGFTLCNKLKTDERTSHIPVILLTAKNTQSDQISGLSKGADLYLTKPFSTEVLLLNVKNFLAAQERIRSKFSTEFKIAPHNIVIQSNDKEFLQKLIDITEECLDDPDFGVETLCVMAAMSQSALYKKLKSLTQMSISEFIKSIRLKKAAQLLASKQYNVSEVSLMIGFYDRKYFSREFKKQFGVNPSKYSDKTDAQ